MPTNRVLEKEQIAVYANTLLESALQMGGQDAVLEVRDQAESVLSVIRSNTLLSDALASGDYTAEQRGQIASQVFADCNPVLAQVLSVMAERDEVGMLSRVLSAFGKALEDKLNVSVVDVTTVVSLDDHLRELIANKAAADLGRNVVLREHIDKSLLGGIIMSAGGKRIDASIASQLENARNVLKETTDGGEC